MLRWRSAWRILLRPSGHNRRGRRRSPRRAPVRSAAPPDRPTSCPTRATPSSPRTPAACDAPDAAQLVEHMLELVASEAEALLGGDHPGDHPPIGPMIGRRPARRSQRAHRARELGCAAPARRGAAPARARRGATRSRRACALMAALADAARCSTRGHAAAATGALAHRARRGVAVAPRPAPSAPPSSPIALLASELPPRVARARRSSSPRSRTRRAGNWARVVALRTRRADRRRRRPTRSPRPPR